MEFSYDLNLPAEIKENHRFCFFGDSRVTPVSEIQKRKQKEPHSPYYLAPAHLNKPEDFAPFNEAMNIIETDPDTQHYRGLGIRLDNNLCCIDIDHSLENQNSQEYKEAIEVIKLFNSYTELSQSGTGAHIFFYADLNKILTPEEIKNYKSIYYQNKIGSPYECYSPQISNKYIALTGNVFNNFSEIKERTKEMKIFLDKFMLKPEEERITNKKLNNIPDLSEGKTADEIIEHLLSIDKDFSFFSLFEKGDISICDYDESRADQKLFCKIIWRIGNNPKLFKEIIFKSKLVREKWFNHKTYLKSSYYKALQYQASKENGFYNKDFYKQNTSSDQSNKEIKPLKYLTASETPDKQIDWLWYPYIPRGAVTMLSAEPGIGKTFLATWISAQVTNNLSFPYYRDINTYGNNRVVYLSEEDDYARTIIPRFKANGGIGENFIYLDRNERPKDFTDKRLAQIVNELEPDLIVFDAMSSYIGGGNANSFNDVRNALNPLLNVIENTKTAVLIIHHLNKMTSETRALNRVSGSVDFTAFIRSGLSVGRNPKNKEQLVMAQFKNNLSSFGESLSFNFKTTENIRDIPALYFDSIIDISADELLGKPRNQAPVVEKAEEALIELLNENNNRMPVKEIKRIITGKGISASSIDRAKRKLNIKHETIKENGKNITYWFIESI